MVVQGNNDAICLRGITSPTLQVAGAYSLHLLLSFWRLPFESFCCLGPVHVGEPFLSHQWHSSSPLRDGNCSANMVTACGIWAGDVVGLPSYTHPLLLLHWPKAHPSTACPDWRRGRNIHFLLPFHRWDPGAPLELMPLTSVYQMQKSRVSLFCYTCLFACSSSTGLFPRS